MAELTVAERAVATILHALILVALHAYRLAAWLLNELLVYAYDRRPWNQG